MKTATMSIHCMNDRYERIQFIISILGLGNIVQERKETSTNPYHPYKYVCVTDTGVTVVKSADKMKIVTMYVTTTKELIRVYDGKKNIPMKIWNKVIDNENKYIRNGKTIWA